MLTLVEARLKVIELLRSLEAQDKESRRLAVNDSYVSERTRGWTFPYNTVRFLETKRPQDGLVGNGPIFVDKLTEKMYALPSGGWKQMLDEYEKTGLMRGSNSDMQHLGVGPQPEFMTAVSETLKRLR